MADGSQLALAGGKLVLGEALIGNGGGITLYPLDPSSGSVGTPVTTPLPSGGFFYVDLDAMQVGIVGTSDLDP